MTTVSLAVWQESDDIGLRRSLAAQVRLTDVLSSVQDAETGQRGYLLTNDPAFLEPYRRAEAQLSARLDALERSVADEPRQAVSFSELRASIREMRATLGTTLAAQEAGAPA